jgi:predicted transcriptional regulator of viral defense system
MDGLGLTRLFEGSQLSVLTARQAATFMRLSPASANVALNRFAARGVLTRVFRGRYCLPDADILSVASGIYHPSYISLMAAFEHHGSTTQSPRIIDVVNPVHSGTMEVVLSSGRYQVRFIRVGASMMFGSFKEIRGGKALMVAEKERAVVDCLLFPGYAPLDEAAACIRTGIDSVRAMDYARRTGRQAVLKRLGHLLSACGSPVDPARAGRLSRTFVPLDPVLPLRGRYDSKWRVIVNRVIE